MGKITILLLLISICSCTKVADCKKGIGHGQGGKYVPFLQKDSLPSANPEKYEDYKKKVYKEGVVCSAKAASQIASAVLVPVYGKEIYLEQPYLISYFDGIWYVEGNLSKDFSRGIFYVEIRQKDGKILKMLHTR